jgi:hypothetical protein
MLRQSLRSTLMHLYRRLNHSGEVHYGGTENTEFSISDLLNAPCLRGESCLLSQILSSFLREIPGCILSSSPAFLLIREDPCKSVVASAFDFGLEHFSVRSVPPW